MPLDAESKTRLKFRVVVLAAFVAIPFSLTGYLWGAIPPFTFVWWLYFGVAHAVISYLFVAGNWSWVGYPLRWTFLVLTVAASANSAGRAGLALSLLAFAWLVGFTSLYIRITAPRAGAVRLKFPLRNGLFYVANGGHLKFLNPHNATLGQKFALDIVQLRGVTMSRSRGLYPAADRAYHIFGAELFSPCDGVVTHVTDNLPDLTPPHTDREHSTGNHILIRLGAGDSDIFVGLAHLEPGSIVVSPDDAVRAGDPIARVGNSGNTSEPHLHIQAKRGGSPENMLDGLGLPMLFSGRALSRNSLIRR